MYEISSYSNCEVEKSNKWCEPDKFSPKFKRLFGIITQTHIFELSSNWTRLAGQFSLEGHLNRCTVNQTWFTVHRIVSHGLWLTSALPTVHHPRVPPHRLAFCSLSVALWLMPPNPSTICCLPGAPSTSPPSSLPFAYLILDILASPTP